MFQNIVIFIGLLLTTPAIMYFNHEFFEYHKILGGIDRVPALFVISTGLMILLCWLGFHWLAARSPWLVLLINLIIAGGLAYYIFVVDNENVFAVCMSCEEDFSPEGDVKLYEEKIYVLKGKPGNYRRGRKIGTHASLEYNASGQLVSKRTRYHYSRTKQPSKDHAQFDYDEAGRLVQEKNYQATITYKYDDKGRMVEKFRKISHYYRMNRDSKITWDYLDEGVRIERVYRVEYDNEDLMYVNRAILDDQGRVIRKGYDEETDTWNDKLEYNDQGQLVKKYLGGTLHWRYLYKYHDNGNLAEEKQWDVKSGGREDISYVTQYDKRGLSVFRTSYLEKGKVGRQWKYENHYDEQGNLKWRDVLMKETDANDFLPYTRTEVSVEYW